MSVPITSLTKSDSRSVAVRNHTCSFALVRATENSCLSSSNICCSESPNSRNRVKYGLLKGKAPAEARSTKTMSASNPLQLCTVPMRTFRSMALLPPNGFTCWSVKQDLRLRTHTDRSRRYGHVLLSLPNAAVKPRAACCVSAAALS